MGFLIGATDRRAFHHELLTVHRTALLGHGAFALVVRPRTLARFLRTRLRPYLQGLSRSGDRGDDTNGPTPGDREAVADLTAIMVTPARRRTGAGREMVERFLDLCHAAGTPTVELVTAIEPADATAFYSRTGWTALRQHVTRDGLTVQRFMRRTDRPGKD